MPQLSGQNWYALAVFGGAGMALGLLGLLACRHEGPGRARPGLMLGLLALAGVGTCSALTDWPPDLGPPLLALAGLLALFRAGRSELVARAAAAVLARARAPRWQWAVLAVGCPVATALLAQATPSGAPKPEPDRELPHGTAPAHWPDDSQAQRARAMASLQEVTEPVALTDRGRRVRLLAMPESVLPPTMLREMEAEMAQDWGPSLRLIRTSPPDGRSDCHGWVFTGGLWWVLGADVEAILEDNGYRPAPEPAPGVLVVYRDDQGQITHTGLVHAAPQGVPVLVESKWCWLGTYLHTPDGHPYGGRPAYYRSARAGHQLTLLPARRQ